MKKTTVWNMENRLKKGGKLLPGSGHEDIATFNSRGWSEKSGIGVKYVDPIVSQP